MLVSGTALRALLLMLAALAGAADPGEGLRDAARDGDVAKVRALLEAGVPADAPARHGHTALMLAAEKGHTGIVTLLLDKGADVNARETFFGVTPLGAALHGGHAALARMLLERGAHGAAEALGAAVRRGDLDLARASLARGEIRPLQLKAARKQAELSGTAEMKALLASAVPATPQRKPFSVPPERMKAYAGRFKGGTGPEMTVAARGERLVVTAEGMPELTLEPVERDYFETAAGDAGMLFAGRAGLVEWAVLNRDGDLTDLGMVTSDPLPMKSASGSAPSAPAAPGPRSEPRPWPQFRGARASGIADGQGVPLAWDSAKGEKVRFKTPVPGLGLSSPVIWGGRIFVTTAVSASGDRTFRTGLYGDPTSVDDLSEHSFRLYALDASTGAVAWDREVHRTKPTVRRHLKSSLSNASPATDGRTVVVLFGAVGILAAYDMEGKQLWSRDIGVLDCNDPQAGTAEWGHASSPILHDGLILVQADRRKDSFMAAYRLDTGREVWRTARDESSTWATPNVVPSPSGAELITNGRTIRAYDPATGKELWTLGPNSEVVVATPVVEDGMTYITAGYPPVRPIYAVRAGKRGDLTLPEGLRSSDAVAWSHERGGTYLPTPILYRGHLYLVNNNGLLSCYRASDGERIYQTRLGELGASFSASPIAADGRLYFLSETGEVYVLRAGPDFELLATNRMEETVMATPAASDGLLVVRTLGHVVGIGDPSPRVSR
ncbi:MAG TPA: PQQ-binding-like beta-propeller repeat protein [Candidatus Polarisedimenticolia bacterium]|nr:PQQ-binding-like beta-propeller repeat protein [Candidatus Polarisedimenticolia bacterium]